MNLGSKRPTVISDLCPKPGTFWIVNPASVKAFLTAEATHQVASVAQDSFDTHAYLNDLRSGHASTKESEQFQRRLNRYRERYLFPDENVTETEDKQA